MRKLWLSMSMCVLLAVLFCPLMARADEAPSIKPVAVVSLPSYDGFMTDLDMIGQITERPQLRDGIEGLFVFLTQGQGLVGLDQSRPSGVLVATDGEELGACAFVPVTNLDDLMAVASAWDKSKIKKLDDGIFEIKTPHKSLFVQETHKGWAYVVNNKDHFQHVPANPAKMLEGLGHRYDAAARIFVANMPAKCREKFVAKIEKKLDRMAKRHEAKHKHAQHHQWNKEKAEHVHKHIKKALNDIEHVTIGLSLDNDLHQGIIEIGVVTREGTPAAKHLAKLGHMRTDFGGFQLPEASVTGRVTSQCAPPSTKHLDKMIDRMHKRAYKKIERKVVNDEQAKAAREIVDMLLDVAKRTAAEGRHDGAVSIALDDKAATMIAGRRVADGPKLEAAVKKAVNEIRKEHADRVDKILTLNADHYHGVNFHVASIPIPDKCPQKAKTVKAVGEQLDVVLGIGRKAVYVAAGRDALLSLKRAIRDSEIKRRWTTAPMELTLDLGELAEFVEDFGPPKCRKKADKIDDLLEKAHGQDRIHVIALPTRRGMTLRVELDEGILRVISAMKCGRK